MKKVIVLIVVMLLMSGCGKSKLTCTKSETEGGVENITTLKTTFKKDDLKKLQLNLEMNLVDENEMDKDSFEFSTGVLKSIYDDLAKDGIKVEDSLKDNKYNIIVDFEENGYSDLKKIINIKLDTFDNLKASLEEDGYTCK